MAKKLQSFNPRQVMSGKEYEIQHKRDNSLHNVEMHRHNFFEIFFLVSGNITYNFNDKTIKPSPGDMLIIKPDESHQITIIDDTEPYERYVLWLLPNTIKALSSSKCDLGFYFNSKQKITERYIKVPLEQRATIKMWLEKLYQEYNSQEFGSELLQKSMLTEILIILNRTIKQKDEKNDVDEHTNLLVDNVTDYINAHLDEKLTLDYLAKQMFVSKSHMCHEFQRLKGDSIMNYIQKRRVNTAHQMLLEGEKPTVVCHLCGFSDYTGFFRAYKSAYGIAPGETNNL